MRAVDDLGAGSGPYAARPAVRRGLVRVFGAGPITGAVDDDPSGIATYSQAGAAYGYGLAWRHASPFHDRRPDEGVVRERCHQWNPRRADPGGTAHRRCNGKAMGEFLPGRRLLALGWTTVAVMALTVLGLGATWLR